MTFQPVTPLPGVAGWRFLERTLPTQEAAFKENVTLQRDIAAFKDRIGGIATAEALVSDRQLMTVALGAFGLDEEIGKTFFLRKMLEDGTEEPGALANRFVDPRYREFSEAFGFGNTLGPRTGLPGFADEIVSAYETRQFEIAVGNSDPNLRLALGFKREIADIASSASVENTGWLKVMGSQPIRAVIEAAFNLPSQFATLDLDRQQADLESKTRELFGSSSPAVFSDPENVELVIERFLTRAQIEAGPSGTTPGIAALTLLQSASSFSAAGQINLILSNG